jgi:hypothetical protein
MSGVPSFVSPHYVAEAALEGVADLSMSLSARLTGASCDQIAPVIAEVLQRVAAATHVGMCQLVEFDDSAAIALTYTARCLAGADDARPPAAVCERWLIPDSSPLAVRAAR